MSDAGGAFASFVFFMSLVVCVIGVTVIVGSFKDREICAICGEVRRVGEVWRQQLSVTLPGADRTNVVNVCRLCRRAYWRGPTDHLLP